MKTLLLTFGILCSVFASAQTASVCTPDTFFTNHYKNDIKDLAVKRMYDLKSPDTVLIEIPSAYCDTIRQAMSPIFNLDTLLQADSVFRRYCIHSYPRGNISPYVTVIVDPSYSWTSGWKALNTVTGYIELDDFMRRYNYSVTGYFTTRESTIATLTATRPINDRAFIDSLKKFDGIYDAYADYGIGSPHSNIFFERNTVNKFIFSMGWGDCPSGCTSGKSWTYQTDDLCNVTLLSIDQSVVDVYWPHPSDCYYKSPVSVAMTSNSTAIKVYPNPVSDELYIHITRGRYTITNMLGQTMLQGDIVEKKAIDVSGIPPGICFLHVVDHMGLSYNSKLIKQ